MELMKKLDAELKYEVGKWAAFYVRGSCPASVLVLY
jgi:hypothetical protein